MQQVHAAAFDLAHPLDLAGLGLASDLSKRKPVFSRAAVNFQVIDPGITARNP